MSAYELILTPLKSEIPADVRLRHVLKSLLRQYRFRCRSIKPVEMKKTKQKAVKVSSGVSGAEDGGASATA